MTRTRKTQIGFTIFALLSATFLLFSRPTAAGENKDTGALEHKNTRTREHKNTEAPEALLNLGELVAEALRENPEIKSARAMADAEKAMIPQARALPDAALGVEQMMIPWNSFNFTQADQTKFSLSQMIPWPGKRGLKGRIARKSAESAADMLAEKERDVVFRVKAAFYELFMIDRNTEITEQHVEILKNFIEIAQSQYSVGMASQQDVLKAQVELSKLLNSRIALEKERESAGAMLNTALNRPPSSALPKTAAAEPETTVFSIDLLEKSALDSRPELRAAAREIERAELAAELARRESRPDFMLSYNRTLDRTEMGLDTWGIMAEVNLPWLQRKKYRSMGEESLARAERARAERDAMKIMILGDLKNALAVLESVDAQLNVYTTSIMPQAKQNIEANLTGYQTGKVDFLMLLDSQRMLLDFQMDYYDLAARHFTKIAEIERTVGREIKE